jgi:cysteine-rich repeat protein
MGQAPDLGRLGDLLKSLFSAEELRYWVRQRFGPAVADTLPGPGASLAQLAFEVEELLRRQGLVDETMFEALIEDYPGRRDDILSVARSAGGGFHPSMEASPGAGTSTSTSASAGAGTSAVSRGVAVGFGGRAEERGQAGTAQAAPVVRVLHLSDFHFRDRTHWDASTVLGRLAADIAGLARDGLAPDLVVLTGDIAHGGKAEEYTLARRWIESELLPAAGVSVERLVIAPGNHDVDRNLVSKGAQHIADGMRRAHDEQQVTEVMQGEDGRLILRRLDAFVAFLNQLGVAGGKLKQPWYRVADEIRGVRVHCAALASAWLSANDGDHGKLLLGLWQCHEVLSEADDAHVVLAALHHPWSYVADWDLAPCRVEIERSAGLVLRGHLHDAGYVYSRSPRHGGVLELAAGACYEDSQYPNSYHLIEIRPDAPVERRARVYPRFWDRTRREWQANLNVFRGPFGELPLRVRSVGMGGAPQQGGGTAPIGASPPVVLVPECGSPATLMQLPEPNNSPSTDSARWFERLPPRERSNRSYQWFVAGIAAVSVLVLASWVSWLATQAAEATQYLEYNVSVSPNSKKLWSPSFEQLPQGRYAIRATLTAEVPPSDRFSLRLDGPHVDCRNSYEGKAPQCQLDFEPGTSSQTMNASVCVDRTGNARVHVVCESGPCLLEAPDTSMSLTRVDSCIAWRNMSCGNNIVEEGEWCDDGNNRSGDGCSANCISDETCGNAYRDVGEECDAGGVDVLGCDSDCTLSVCGDGYVNAAVGEECDDGNRNNGDGCSESCQLK